MDYYVGTRVPMGNNRVGTRAAKSIPTTTLNYQQSGVKMFVLSVAMEAMTSEQAVSGFLTQTADLITDC